MLIRPVAAVPLEQLILDDYRQQYTPESLPLMLIRDQMAGEVSPDRSVSIDAACVSHTTDRTILALMSIFSPSHSLYPLC